MFHAEIFQRFSLGIACFGIPAFNLIKGGLPLFDALVIKIQFPAVDPVPLGTVVDRQRGPEVGHGCAPFVHIP